MHWKIIGIIVGVFVLILAAGIILNSRNAGDPGNKRLNEIANDSVFSVLPPNASLDGAIVKVPAQYRHPAFQGAGWDGPSVQLNFISNEPKETIYKFYTKRAVEAGWQSGRKDNNGNTDVWTKTYPDNARAILSLFGPLSGNRYTLAGSAPAIMYDKNVKY